MRRATMNKMKHKVQHGGPGQQFQFELEVKKLDIKMKQDIDDSIPSNLFVLEWKRKARLVCTSGQTMTTKSRREGEIKFNQSMSMLSTLFSTGKGFEHKEYKFQLEEQRQKGHNKIVCSSVVNLGEYADLLGTPRHVEIPFKSTSAAIESCVMRCTITSQFLRENNHDTDTLSCISDTSLHDDDIKALQSDEEEVEDESIDLRGIEFGVMQSIEEDMHLEQQKEEVIRRNSMGDNSATKEAMATSKALASPVGQRMTFAASNKAELQTLMGMSKKENTTIKRETSENQLDRNKRYTNYLEDLSSSDEDDFFGDAETLESLQKKNKKLTAELKLQTTKGADVSAINMELEKVKIEVEELNNVINTPDIKVNLDKMEEIKSLAAEKSALQEELESLQNEKLTYSTEISKLQHQSRRASVVTSTNRRPSQPLASMQVASENQQLVQDLIACKCELANLSYALGEVILEKKAASKKLALLKINYIELTKRVTAAELELTGL